jgi:acetyl esterase
VALSGKDFFRSGLGRGRRPALWVLLVVLSLVSWTTWARPFRASDVPKLPPDFKDIPYGPHVRNVFDLWCARGNGYGCERSPLVVFFHGGAFRMGDKASVSGRLIARCLAAGISVASANYRFSQDAPYPAPMLDGARAIQFFRAHAEQFGIDPTRIAASGSSAGAGIALWVGFHDDLADPTNDDPVLCQSTRLACLGVDGAQCSYDPRFIKALLGGRVYEHPALLPLFGLRMAFERDWPLPRVSAQYEDASPINHLSRDDPAVIAFYVEPDGPISSRAKPGDGIHHPRFGKALKDRMDGLGVECIVRHEDDYPFWDDRRDDVSRDLVAFLARHLIDAR